MLRLIFFLCIILNSTKSVFADIYKTADKTSGRVFYTDCPKGGDYYLIIKTAKSDKATVVSETPSYVKDLQLAENGNADAEFWQGCNVTNDYAKALAWFRKAAEQNHLMAMFEVGNMIYQGHGSPQNYQEAFSWFQRAAKQSHVDAQYMLGYMFENGEGVTSNYSNAYYWYVKAGEQGHIAAQFKLGVLNFNGLGTPQNYIEAHKWFNLVGATGDQEAIKNRNLVEQRMTASQISKAQQMAVDLKTKFDNQKLKDK